jgi:hypothetical protein
MNPPIERRDLQKIRNIDGHRLWDIVDMVVQHIYTKVLEYAKLGISRYQISTKYISLHTIHDIIQELDELFPDSTIQVHIDSDSLSISWA